MDQTIKHHYRSFERPAYQSRYQREVNQAIRERARILGQQANRERIEKLISGR